MTSTVRIAFDGEPGIPEAALVPDLVAQYRSAGIRFAELGRFVIDGSVRGPEGPFKNYYRAYYELGRKWDVDVYLIFVPENKTPFYRRLMDACIMPTSGGDFVQGYNAQATVDMETMLVIGQSEASLRPLHVKTDEEQ